MYPVVFYSLSSEQQLWYGEAIVRIIMADGKRHQTEESFLKKIIVMFQNTDHQEHINALLKSEVQPICKVEGISEAVKMMIFYDCIVIAIADGEFVKEEEEELYKIAEELQILKTDASNMVSWGKSLIERLSLTNL